MKQRVTVLINTINEKSERLEKAIESYLNQDGVEVEILISTIVDDVSIEIGNRMGCKVIINGRKGIYEQLNNAVKFIDTEWWCYASGHDLAYPNKLISEVECCIKNNKKVCYSNYELSYPEGGDTAVTFFDYDHTKHLQGNFVNDCAMINTEMSRKYFPFNHEQWGNDSFYDFWLRVYEGEGNIFCWNNIVTWKYIQFDDSKHIIRRKNEEELAKYHELRKRMLDSHKQIPLISVGLPVYRCKLTWLSMESLVRQKTCIPWELIICEDEFEAHGKDYFMQWKDPLLKAGCLSIKYIMIPKNNSIRNRFALSLKWRIIVQNCSDNSIGMIMQDSDDYSEPNRIQSAYNKFVEGYDWIHSRFGLFYHIYKDKTILFDLNTVPQPNTGLSKAVRLDLAKYLPEEEKFSSVDNWIFTNIKKIKSDLKVYYDESSDYLYGCYTDGENTISKNRERNYDNIKYPFMKTNKRIRHYLPIEIYNRLARKEKITQAAVSRSVYFFEDKLFDKFGFQNRRTNKGDAFILDPYKPMIMFGCYTESDFKLILNHQSNVVIIWAGSDSMPYNYDRMRQFVGKTNIHHISGSKFISDDLTAVGLEYSYYPICFCDHSELSPCTLGDKIYVYTARGKNDPEFYGKSIYDKLIEHYGKEMFILANADTYSKEEVYKLYGECFVGLRLVKHDGLSETVAELGLMGRNVIYNGDTPNSLNYDSIADIINHIDNERKKQGYVDVQLSKRMEDFLNCGTDWMFIKKGGDIETKSPIVKFITRNNKLGVAYSVFDDLEHLRESLLSIRKSTDYIVIVYQNVSFTGHLSSMNIYKELSILKKEGLIDNIQEFKPDLKLISKVNEVKKRNLGLEICKQNHCTHYITMDCDEIFLPKQFEKAKQIVYDYDYKASFIYSQTYYKDKNHVVYPPEQFHIPFIYKIMDGKFKLDAKIDGIVADKSRKMTNVNNDLIIFDRDFIELHHLCYVRNNISQKVSNKASSISQERINKIMESYVNFSKWKMNQMVYTENGELNIKKILFSAL